MGKRRVDDYDDYDEDYADDELNEDDKDFSDNSLILEFSDDGYDDQYDDYVLEDDTDEEEEENSYLSAKISNIRAPSAPPLPINTNTQGKKGKKQFIPRSADILPSKTPLLKVSDDIRCKSVDPERLRELESSMVVFNTKPVVQHKKYQFLEVEPRELVYLGQDTKAPVPTLTCVMMGHVDSGKSSLTARLLLRDNFDDVDHTELHGFLDFTAVESDHGVTTCVKVRDTYLSDGTPVLLLDAPGHQDFVLEAIRGCCLAQTVILVVSVTDTRIMRQTRDHLLVAKALGIDKLIVAINKMDTINWDKTRFDVAVNILRKPLKSFGFSKDRVVFVPTSAWTSGNVTKRHATSFYKGFCLLELLEQLASLQKSQHDCRRSAPVVQIMDHSYFTNTNKYLPFAKVASGILNEREPLIPVGSSNQDQLHKIILHRYTKGLSFATNQLLVLNEVLEEYSVGTQLVLANSEVYSYDPSTLFKAQIMVFPDCSVEPIWIRGSRLSIILSGEQITAEILKIEEIAGFGEGKCIQSGDSATIVIKLAKPWLLVDSKIASNFIVRYKGEIISLGKLICPVKQISI
eukprot:TRINITY_DN11618_c0_g1_i1.p1 TRINITY_DN11618_c0_g1~~TRINITY_DN11618_c0_g1_i1.p1  ORF type:complete len:574 (+),score=154.55 TRINITY_DN11618_c0_g1_i1:47-1768(+)